MLKITRSAGESFTIGDDITIRIDRTGRKVSIAINAPRDLLILRSELAESGDIGNRPRDDIRAA